MAWLSASDKLGLHLDMSSQHAYFRSRIQVNPILSDADNQAIIDLICNYSTIFDPYDGSTVINPRVTIPLISDDQPPVSVSERL